MEMEYLTLDHSAVFIVENDSLETSGKSSEYADNAFSENRNSDPDARIHWLI